MAALLVAVAAVASVGYPVYVDPPVATLSADEPVDAIVALGGAPASAEHAVELGRQGLAGAVVVSDPYQTPDVRAVHRLCSPAADHATGVTCFEPDPATTRGEARAIADLAEANGWERVAVVAPRYHIARARFVVARCYPGDLVMVAPDLDVSWHRWGYEYAYQTAAFGKAAMWQRGC